MDKGFVPILGHSACRIIFGAIDSLCIVAKVARTYNESTTLRSQGWKIKTTGVIKIRFADTAKYIFLGT